VVFAEIVTAAASTPDAIGWKFGRSTLVECKVSRSDFARDRRKNVHMVGRVMGWERWYMTPPGLVQPHEVPEGWGLLEAHERCVRVRCKATPALQDARSLSDEVALLVSACRRHQVGAPWLHEDARFVPLAKQEDAP